MYSVMVQELGAPFTLGCVLASAERALLDEPPPTSRRLVKGDSVMIDMFPMLGSYAADYARTYLVGEPDLRQREQHGVLEAALAKGEAMLRPGVIASEIDRAVRSVIEQSDFAAHAYQHHTGHSYGLTIPEAPWLIPADHTRLRAGMIIAIEPGIYHPVSGGMRLEGNFLITEDGCEALDGYPRILTVCS